MSQALSQPDLAREILRLYSVAQTKAADAVARAGEAIAAVIACGNLLMQAKSLCRHGEWLDWLEAHCGEIHRATAARYMSLAVKARDLDLECAKTIRQAYVLAELLPEPDPSERSESPEPSPYLVHVARLERSITLSFAKRPITTWTPDERALLKERLAPLVQVYAEL